MAGRAGPSGRARPGGAAKGDGAHRGASGPPNAGPDEEATANAADVERLARDAVEMFNRAEWDRLPDLMTADVVYEETGTGRRVEGREEFLPHLQGWREALPDVRGEVLRTVGDDEVCVVEIRWRGTQDGPLPVGDATLPPSGRSMDVLASLWVQCRDNRIVAERHHLDILSMLTQLGALPASAAV